MENKETTFMDVIVHKAKVTLQGKESIGDFTRSLSDAARAHLVPATTEKSGGWMVEAYGDKVVMEYWKDGAKPRYKYIQLNYTRDAKGAFSFSKQIEVKRVTVFKPKASMIGITKAAEAELWEAVAKSEEVATAKSLFGNIL